MQCFAIFFFFLFFCIINTVFCIQLTKKEILAAFAETDFLSIPRISQLKNFFGTLENAWKCTNIEDYMMAGITEKSAKKFFEKKKNIVPEESLEKIQKTGSEIIFYEDKKYPKQLKNISAAPVLFFLKGKLEKRDVLSLAVVGSRKISAMGKQAIHTFLPDLCAAGLSIVSGLAKGVDAAAHTEALHCGGRTIAVLGNGIDSIYPNENRGLAEEIIASGGAVISEFFPGVPPNHFNFPRRNRIVSGLSLGTFVVEGAQKSGSLITAQYALEQNKEVFALPGNPFAMDMKGANILIQKGSAKLVMQAQDILEELPITDITAHEKVQQRIPTNALEKQVFETLTNEPEIFDDLVRKTEITPSQFSATLTILEMKGFATNLGGNRWIVKN